MSIKPLDDELIALIWRRMIILYDHKWTSKLGLGVTEDGFLTEAAAVWSEELSDVTFPDLKHGFSQLRSAFPEWPPSVLEFRKLCLSQSANDIPTLDEITQILVTVSMRKGTLAVRYQHPLALAISCGVDMFSIRTAKVADAKRMIKPMYDRLLSTGWNDWPAHAHQEQKALA